MKISACLVVHNEEVHIERCLESIKGVVDEIIVIHDGECVDKTLDICRRYTDKIFTVKFAGIAEPHRPLSYAEASGDWILQIDADEYLSQGLKDELKNLAADDGADAYELLWPIWNGEKYITESWPRKRCLFRKNKLSFLGIPQYVAEINGAIKKIDLILEHRPDYNNYSLAVFKSKWLKWAKLQAFYYLQDFNTIVKFNFDYPSWPKKIRLRLRFPLLLLPAEFFVTLIKILFSGGGCHFIGYKIALLTALYRASVNYYIFKNK